MNNSWIAVFVIIIIIMSQTKTVHKLIVLLRMRRNRGVRYMSDYLKKCVGKKCLVSTGSLGSYITGVIIHVEDKWIEIEAKNGSKNEIYNLDFVQRIKILED